MFTKNIEYAMSRTHGDQHVGNSATKIIKMIKVYLMSRNKRKQIQAINKILEILRSKGDAVNGRILIAADIPELLCEVLNTHDVELIGKAFSCMLEWSKDKDFYKHPTVIIETTCRTIRILSTEENTNTTIYKGMELLGHILIGCEQEVTIDLNYIFSVASLIIKSSRFQGSHLAALSLLKFILKAEVFDHEELPQLIYLALTNLTRLSRNNLNRFNKHFKLITQIMSYSMWYLSLHPDNPLSPRAINVIWNLIKTSVVPYIKTLGVTEVEANIVTRGVNCIVNSYKYLDEKRLKFLSNHLAEEGYLTLLPEMDKHFNKKTLHSYIQNLLCHILVRLGKNQLKLSVSDCMMIGKGLQKLPADSTKWLELLARPQSESVSLVIILYHYFVLHCNESFTTFSTQLPALCQYLLYQSSPPSTSMLKAITFVFAVFSLSYCQSEEMFNNEQYTATHKLLQWLTSSTLIEVFTYHPAMLYWIFSDPVSAVGSYRNLQMKSLYLWVRNKSTAANKQLEDLALKIEKVAYRLVDLLTLSQIVEFKVLSILKLLIAREKSETSLNISTYIWHNMSKTLSLLNEPGWEKRTNKLSCVMFLACKVEPPCLDNTLMLRLTEQLVEIFQAKCGKTWEETEKNTRNTDIQLLFSQLFKLTHIIINKMNLVKDYRGLEIFLEQESLARACLACLESDNKRVPHSALGLLNFLLQCQKWYNIQMKTRGTVICGTFFIHLLTKGSPHTLCLTGELFSNIRTFENKDFIRLSRDMNIPTIHSLYHLFLNLSLKQNMVPRLSWKCLSQLLLYCRLSSPETEKALLYHPMNKEALKMAYNRNSINDPFFVLYLLTYVMGVKFHKVVTRHSYDRALCVDSVSTNLTIIAENLVAGDWPVQSNHTRIIRTICTVGGNIPVEIVKQLKMKIPHH